MSNETTRPEPAARIFQSMDPTWRKWGVTPKGWNTKTRWFHRKADAVHFMRTGQVRGEAVKLNSGE